ncbi:tetratricopeptide repeat protein [Streptomyces sp. NPDC094149]|uniref:tetratricopeptide repeat protein n=1 Tax=Streptomyces sp. NPDC094149 TaxID=3155079 RepID=UPI003316D8BD
MTESSASRTDNSINGGTYYGPVVQAGSVTMNLPPAPAPPLGILSVPSSVFVGRDHEVQGLLDVIDPDGGNGPRSRVGLVTGAAGMGKSELLLQVAHRAVDRGWFPGGVLSIDLNGFSSGLAPLTPADALRRLLQRLGLPLDAIPEHAEDRAAVYRECLRDRSVLVLLDNTRDSAQVQSLLPPYGCAALVSSRNMLPALDDARRLPLSDLSPDASCELFLAAADPRTGTDAEGAAARSHAQRIATSCAGLPLALRVAAAQVRGETADHLAELATSLDDKRKRLVELDDGERAVAASIGASYDILDEGERLLFALCGLHPGSRVGVHAVAALADLPPRDVRRRMQRLRNIHLVEADGVGHYKVHDLFHVYARQRAHEDLPEADTRAAMDRLIDCYLYTADRADAAVAPGRYRLPHTVAHPPHSIPDVDERDAALAWFAEEMPQLSALLRVAATTSDRSRCWILADAMRGFFFHTKAWDSWLETLQVALDAATDAGEVRVQSVLHNSMGVALIEQGRSQDAARHYEAAMAGFEAVGDAHGVATAVENRAWVHQYAGDHVAALADHQQALDVYGALGARRNTAIVQRGMALAEIELGRYEDATAHLTQALDVFVELGLDLDSAMALNGLGEAHASVGRAEPARRHFLRALRRSRACGSLFEEARACEGLSALLAATDPRRAAHHGRRALAHYQTLRSPKAEQVRSRLTALGDPGWPTRQSTG